LAQEHKDTRNGDRKDQACDPPGLEGCFPHPLTVLRLRVEQRNGWWGKGPGGTSVVEEDQA
jgi:hypothetical protein